MPVTLGSAYSSSMMSEFELLQAVQAIEDDLPGWMAAFDPKGLRNVMHRHYDELLSQAPNEMQDRLHDRLRALMVRAGVVRDQLCAPPDSSPRITTAGRRAGDLELGRYPSHPDS